MRVGDLPQEGNRSSDAGQTLQLPRDNEPVFAQYSDVVSQDPDVPGIRVARVERECGDAETCGRGIQLTGDVVCLDLGSVAGEDLV
jgi:hypothetical protein